MHAHVVPKLGGLKVVDVASLISQVGAPTAANRVLSVVRRMFNLAEVRGPRPDVQIRAVMCRHFRSADRHALSPMMN
jgi:hypothetical protein